MGALTTCSTISTRSTPASTPSSPVHFEGALYRALNPIYAREPMSGRGAELLDLAKANWRQLF